MVTPAPRVTATSCHGAIPTWARDPRQGHFHLGSLEMVPLPQLPGLTLLSPYCVQAAEEKNRDINL